jgi:hypothetical protein
MVQFGVAVGVIGAEDMATAELANKTITNNSVPPQVPRCSSELMSTTVPTGNGLEGGLSLVNVAIRVVDINLVSESQAECCR